MVREKKMYMLFSLPMMLASMFIVRRFKQLQGLSALLSASVTPREDIVHLRMKDDETHYAQTKPILRNVDYNLHKQFKHNDDLARVYYIVAQAQYKRRNLFGHRGVSNVHVVRTDGTLRDSVAEIAHAIAHHWKISTVVGITATHMRGVFRTFRRSSSARKVSLRKSSDGTRRMTRKSRSQTP